MWLRKWRRRPWIEWVGYIKKKNTQREEKKKEKSTWTE